MSDNVIYLHRRPIIQQPPITNSAEVILMITPDHPKYGQTKLQILAAHYWGKSA